MNSRKIILMSLIFILVLCLFSATTLAADDGIDSLLTSITQPDVSMGDNSGAGIMKAMNTILGLVQVAGTGVALISVSLLGIKYMLASAEDKAEIKKYMIGACIGGFLVFGGVEIAQIIADFTPEVLK